MTTAIAASIDILEYVHSGGKPLEIDREKGIIKGVKILGESSGNPPPNNNVYPRQTRERLCEQLKDGARVYIDHAPRSAPEDARSYRDAIGAHKNIREGGDGLYADFHFNPKHALAEQLLWDAVNAPECVGFSMASKCGRDSMRDGRRIIEDIAWDARRHSFDLVSRPATTRAINESLGSPPVKKKIRDLIESLKATRPGYSRALREMAEAGIMSPDAEADDPGMKGAEVTEPADHEAALKTGFEGAMLAVLRDEGMDMKAKLKKLKEIMTAQEKLTGSSDEPPTPADPPAGDAGAFESLRLQMAGRDMLADAGLRCTPVVRKALEACKSKADITSLVESLKAEQGTQQTPAGTGASGDLLQRRGAKSAAVTEKTLGLQESLASNGQQDGKLKFEGDKAQQERISFLRGNGRR
jgi:hypothetical protein